MVGGGAVDMVPAFLLLLRPLFLLLKTNLRVLTLCLRLFASVCVLPSSFFFRFCFFCFLFFFLVGGSSLERDCRTMKKGPECWISSTKRFAPTLLGLGLGLGLGLEWIWGACFFPHTHMHIHAHHMCLAGGCVFVEECGEAVRKGKGHHAHGHQRHSTRACGRWPCAWREDWHIKLLLGLSQ